MDTVRSIELLVREFMAQQDKAHDFYHIDRVRKMALKIAAIEGGDVEVIELAALVHDIGDFKFHASEQVGVDVTKNLLEKCGVSSAVIERVMDITRRVSFKGADAIDSMPTLEGKIVQDADRLDTIGAIGIARTFTYGGSKGRALYNPGEDNHALSKEVYTQTVGSSSIAHFYDKLFLLKDRLHTRTAREIAEPRHAFMVQFVEQFKQEWDVQ